MHDAHPVYRVEQTAAWNLRPGVAPSTVRSTPAAARSSNTQRDAEVAELNKQRAATRAFTEQTEALNQRLTELGKAVAQTSEVAKQNLLLKQEMESIRARLEAMQEQTRNAPPGAEPRPSTPPDDKW